ncbi:MAG: hypothetical protein WC321_06695 [Candidatus Omnitrophota bacterium]
MAERRQYIRLDTVLPVEFHLISLDGKKSLSERLQGFTNNVSKGGICLAVNNLKPDLAGLIMDKQAKISLSIELPITKKIISALADSAWVSEEASRPDSYLIGLSYAEIDQQQNKQLIYYARAKKLFAPAALTLIIVLGLGFGVGGYLNLRLLRSNRILVGQLVRIVQESSIAKQKVKEISREREDLQSKIQNLQLRMQTVEKEKESLGQASRLEKAITEKKIKDLNALIESLDEEKNALQEELIVLQHKESSVTEDLLHLDEKKATLEKANLYKMYQWLQARQNQRSGLVRSFEGSADVSNLAFIYDQSLAVQAYTSFSDFERVGRALDFFQRRAKRANKLFFNAYSSSDGSAAEQSVYSRPNIWLGIAILQYIKKTDDPRYLSLAEEIAGAIISLQSQGQEGGIRGGPDLTWLRTEDSLDAYAFFNMLYKITGKSQYARARDKTLVWLLKAGLDTYVQSVLAIGPQKLEELGINPGRIMDFAEETYVVEVLYQRPDGMAVKVKGFDSLPKINRGRAGIVYSERTARAVTAFKTLADYYYKKGMKAKAHVYEMKADEYMAELGKMMISSPSPSGREYSCLPYATLDVADTGYGWLIPKGTKSGSVAATAQIIFAYYDYNPLRLDE